MMTIAIDGGALSISDDRLKVGVYRVASNLIKEIPRIDVKNNYRVYTFTSAGQGTPPGKAKNLEFVPLISAGFRMVWQPLEMMRHRVDTYLGISQAFPVTLYDVNKIGFIYDVGFLEHPEYYRESYFALKSQTADVVNRSRHIITISQASADSIRNMYHVPKEKLTVAYLGVEKGFTFKGTVHKRNHPYFLFVGALKPGKNVPMMLRSFAAFLAQSKHQYDFVLAGSDYWIDPGISATINTLGLKHRVHSIGFHDDETLAGYYRGATALLTVSQIEGFGLPCVEAMSCGTPVIASTAGSFPEVVGNSGIMVDPDDEQALTAQMLAISTDRQLRMKLSEKGRRKARQFNWTTFTRTVLETAGALTRPA